MTGQTESQFLHDIRVVELGQYIAAPGATALLSNLGADVVKVEPVDGEACRHLGVFGDGMLRAHNRGKRSLTLQLRDPESRELLNRLLATADVVVHNMRPGGMEDLGLGVTELRALYPDLVVAAVSGFGSRGPCAARPGLDIAAQAESGLMWTVGEAGGKPLRVGSAIVDAATAHVVVEAVLAALLRRERSGGGASVEVSLLDTAIHLQSATFHEYASGGGEPVRSGNGQAAAAPAADLVRTADGYVVLSAYTPAAWSCLTRLVGRPELAEDPRFADNPARVAHRVELLRALDEAFAGWTTEETVAHLTSHGIVVGAVRSYPEVLSAPDVVAAGMIEHAGDLGPDFRIHSPYLIDGRRPTAPGEVPEAGQHTIELRTELGLDRSITDDPRGKECA